MWARYWQSRRESHATRKSLDFPGKNLESQTELQNEILKKIFERRRLNFETLEGAEVV